MSKLWTVVLVVVLGIGAGFLTGCTSSCDTCGKPIVDACTCGAPDAAAPGGGGSCGGGGGS